MLKLGGEAAIIRIVRGAADPPINVARVDKRRLYTKIRGRLCPFLVNPKKEKALRVFSPLSAHSLTYLFSSAWSRSFGRCLLRRRSFCSSVPSLSPSQTSHPRSLTQ